jgi:hypothetical protein
MTQFFGIAGALAHSIQLNFTLTGWLLVLVITCVSTVIGITAFFMGL